jgi:hypothetical protein
MAYDGANIFAEIQISDGATTGQTIRPVFEDGTTAATIDTYCQAIVTANPSMDAAIRALVGKVYK